MTVAADVVCLISSVVLVVLVLAHRASGGGLSDLFGGASSPASSSAHAGRNLTRLTAATGALWLASVVVLGLLAR